MKREMPLVSVCIPIYNGAQFLQEALDSIKIQTYKNIEVIVSDDASSDNSLELVEKFKKEVDFPVFVYAHQPQGIGANWNNSVDKANGKYIKFLFQDDVLAPTCIEKMVAVLEQDSSIGLVASKREFLIEKEMKTPEIDKWLQIYGDLQEKLELTSQNNLIYIDKSLFARDDFKKSPLNKIGEPSVVMFEKSLYTKIGGFDTNLKQILDYVFCYRVLKYKKIAVIKECLVNFRIHGEQATNQNRSKKINDYELYNQILYKEFYPYLNKKLQQKLKNKYSFFWRNYQKIKKKIKNKLHA